LIDEKSIRAMTTQSTVYVREATIKDIPLVIAILKEIKTDADLATYLEDYASPSANLETMLLMAEIDRIPVGFLRYTVLRTTWGGSYVTKLDDLIVAESARGRHVGSALMRHLAETAPLGVAPRDLRP
jgi:GNAT superfamily N-acetyltransferase